MGDFRDATQEQIDEMKAQLQFVWDANHKPGYGLNTEPLRVIVSYQALDDLIRGWDLRQMLQQLDERHATRNELMRAVVDQAKTLAGEWKDAFRSARGDECTCHICNLIRAVRTLQAEEARLQAL